MEIFIELMKDINIGQLVAMGLMLWFFYARLDRKIDKLDEKLSKRIDALDQRLSARIDALDQRLSARMDTLDDKVNSIDKRLVAIETILHYKEGCLFKDEKNMKKAE